MTSRTSRSPRGLRDAGFTFLELLLVLLLLSVCAAMALPRLTGVQAEMLRDRQKRAIARLVRHAEHQARLTGQVCVLHWEETDHCFELRWRGGWPGEERTRVFDLEAESFRSVDAHAFAEFALTDARLTRAESGEEILPSLPVPEPPELDALIERLEVHESLEIRTTDFPVQFSPTGLSSAGLIHARNEEEFAIEPLAAASEWRRQ